MKERIEKFGTWAATIGENIAYGTTGGKEIVLQLIIDDGVASRGHRTNIFKPEFLILGSWASVHGTYSTETVLDYAGGMTTNSFRAPEKNYDCATKTGNAVMLAAATTAAPVIPVAPVAPVAPTTPTVTCPVVTPPAAPAVVPAPATITCDATSATTAVKVLSGVEALAPQPTVIKRIRFANTECVFDATTSTAT